jgi:uncharacterized membrane protein YccC
MLIEKARRFLAKGSNRIAMVTAVRGTISTVVPLVVFPRLGFGPAASLAIIGALNAAMIDTGGSYGSRLAAMASVTFIGPCIMLAGMAASANWIAAAALMFTIAFLGGFARAAGSGAIPVGLNLSVMFLIGIEVVPPHADQRLAMAAGVISGGLWTIVVALAFWQLRPYRRVEMELASLWQALADLVVEAMPPDLSANAAVRELNEQRFTRQILAIRTMLEQARSTLGDIRAETHGVGANMGRLLVVVRAVARIEAAMVALHEAGAIRALGDTEAMRVWADALGDLEKACRTTATVLLNDRGLIDYAAVRKSFNTLVTLVERRTGDRMSDERIPRPWILAMARAVRHLDSAEETLRALFQARHSFFSLRIPPLTAIHVTDGLRSMRAQLTPESLIFRHAARIALVGAAATGVVVSQNLPHGLWLAMTPLIILQPDYGGTLTKAMHRGLGTLAGAVLASILLATLHGTVAFEVMIAFLLFFTFLLLRRNYGVAMTFLTPLVILLLGLGGTQEWVDLQYRVMYTVAGAVLALVAGYVLWPVWEHDRLPERFARAIRAGRTYLIAILDAMLGGEPDLEGLGELRRTSEIEAGNADAAFQRMLSEQRAHRGNVTQALALDTYVQRLARHILALAGHVGSATLAVDCGQELRLMLGGALEDVAEALPAGRPPAPRPNFDSPLERVREQLQSLTESDQGAAVAFLLGQIVADVTALHSAAANWSTSDFRAARKVEQPAQIA